MSRRFTLPLMLILAGFTVMGCTASEPKPQRVLSVEDLPIIWQQGGTNSRLRRPIRLLARDAETLADIPLAEVPVDWNEHMVLVHGLGPTPTAQNAVTIVRVWREGSVIKVQERQIHPGPDAVATGAPGSPWTIAIIPRSDWNVEGYSTSLPAKAFLR